MSGLRLPRWRDHGIGLLLCVGYVALLAATNTDIGIPRDESFYIDAGDNAGRWWLNLTDPKVESLSKAQIDRGFRYNHEHPVLMKSLFGVSHELLVERWEWVDSHLLGYRLPTMVLAGCTLWLTYLLGLMVGGPLVGWAAALALAWMPRYFFHAHLACFDAPVTFTWLLVCYTYLRAARSRVWALASGVALGLGFATKLNIFFVPFALLLVAAVDTWRFKRTTGAWRAPAGERGPLTYYSWIAVSMLVLGFVVFYVHWPWLWHDTLKRLGGYYAFHARHEHYPVDYLGTLYYRPPFPVHFPFVFAFVTLPIGVLVLGAIGLWRVVGDAIADLKRPAGPHRRAAELVLLVNLMVPFAVIAMPYTPIFGGTKHWMPAMPFLAVIAGVGASRLAEELFSVRRYALLGGVLATLMLLPGLHDTLRYGTQGPAYFNAVVGGPPGAAEVRMPRNFWGHSTASVLPFVDAEVERRAYVFWHKATLGSIRAYKRDGALRGDVRYTGDWTAPYSNWAVYHDQMEKLPEEVDVWRAYGTDWPVGGHFVDGVQLMSVYHRPAAPKAPPIPPGGR